MDAVAAKRGKHESLRVVGSMLAAAFAVVTAVASGASLTIGLDAGVAAPNAHGLVDCVEGIPIGSARGDGQPGGSPRGHA